MRAVFVAAGGFVVGLTLAALLVPFAIRLDLGDLFLVLFFGGPLVVGLVAGTWAYRHPPLDALGASADQILAPTQAHRPHRRRRRPPPTRSPS